MDIGHGLSLVPWYPHSALKVSHPDNFRLNKPETYATHKFQAFIAKTATPGDHSQQLTFVENSLAQN
jgi:hypothetical protein